MQSPGLAMLLVLALPLSAAAEKWTSSDGFLSVNVPDSKRFQAVEQAPFLALWLSDDGSTRLAVLKMEIPQDARLRQTDMEEGLAKEIRGTVTRLPTRQLSGHEVWNMSVQSPPAEITQAVVRHDGTVYKVMTVVTGNNADRASIEEFIASITLVQTPGPPQTNENGSGTHQKPHGGMGVNEISGRIGALGVFLLIGIGIYCYSSGKKNRQG